MSEGVRPSASHWIRGLALGTSALAALAFSGAAAKADDKPLSLYFVGCAPPTGFHGYLARGATEGKNLGVQVTYIYPDELTIPNQVQKIEEAIAAHANGIALCEFAEDKAYADVAKRAKDAGIAFGSAARRQRGLKSETRMTFSFSARARTKKRLGP